MSRPICKNTLDGSQRNGTVHNISGALLGVGKKLKRPDFGFSANDWLIVLQ